MTAQPREWVLGRNTFRFEPPDLLEATIRGLCSLEESIQLVDLFQQLGTIRPFFLLVDMAAVTGVEAEARRYIGERFQHEWFLGIIHFHARLLHRALAKGVLIAHELSRAEPHPLIERIHFVSTRAQARALYAQLRAVKS